MAKKPAYRAGRDQAATAENVELLTGQRGDRLDKAVTFRELAALGLSTLRPGAGGVHVPGKNPDLFPPGQMEFPHAPVNVIANGAFHTVLVEWDPPQYRGHAHAEIWRAESDNQAEATLVGTSSANLFSDAIGKGATFYYWVRFVNGKDDKGPFQGMQGVKAETSRDVQDILDELQGKIEESHLAQTLLGPIEQVPQLQLDIAILKPKVAAIEDKIPSIEQELAGLDERQKAAQDLLDDAQQQLGMSSIEIGLVQDRLNAKLDKYKGDFDSFRDAVFVVDPENGSITMDAVNAVRDELHTSITEVHQELDAVAGQISSKADNVTVDSQGSRITEAEQRISGLDASLSQTVTRGEFTGEQQRVTQIGQELDATKGELTQKATKQEVDAQGVRLANAESKLTAHTDELSSQAQRLDGLAAQVTLGDATLQANITELARVTAESDQVTAQRVSGLEVRAGTSEAKIQALEEIIEDDGGITAGRFDTIIAELELQRGLDDDNASAAIDGALAVDERDRETKKAFGAIRTEQRVILTEQQAQALRTTEMEVKFDAKDAATQARIASVEKVTSDADSALSQRISVVDSEFKAADAATNAAVAAEVRSRSDADSAMAKQIQQVTANYQQGDRQLQGQITAESVARADAMQALGSQINTVSAVAGSKNKTFFQATAPGSGMGTGDLWFDTDSNNRPYRYSGTAWIATDDPRIAANAAAVQLQSQAIANLQNGAQAMWTAKASAGQITAGIGLIAKSDGTSQVMVSASQFFVFNPNSPSTTAPLFAIDNGQAVIAEAIIRKATIQILNSEKITADYVKAGVSISSPLINGGQIDMGNAFMAGGAAGFGKGGPYGGWGWGWHTIIYADGSLYTNRLYAEGGYVRNMTIGNCTIDEDCVVRGTIYANRIVGDVTNMFTHKGAFSVPAYNRARNLILVQGGIRYRRRISGQGTIGLNVHVYLNGDLIETQTTTVNLPTGGSVDIAVSIQPFMKIPANTSATISFATSTSGNVSDLGPEYNDTDRAVWLMALS
ncbi:phage tail tip fiber protein [Aeromonas sanarellii]